MGWLPTASEPASSMATQADFAACLDLLRKGSKSFHAASRLLPGRLRQPVYALYAFCRVADDAADHADGRSGTVEAMRIRLDSIYDGRPIAHPIDIAFAATVERHAIPRELPEALFEGFEWDQAGRRYLTLSELRDYAVRVAGTVGAMMALLMGVRHSEALARACDLGVAMQLTNIARDIGEDARAGRLYIPIEWFAAAGIDPDRWLDAPVFDENVARFTAQLLDEADRLYRRAEHGIAHLPADCRPAIWGARYIYDAIGARIRANRLDSVSVRAYVGRNEKLKRLGKACVSSLSRSAKPGEACLAEASFVLATVARVAPAPQARGASAVDAKIGWLIDLFERLERNERFGANA